MPKKNMPDEKLEAPTEIVEIRRDEKEVEDAQPRTQVDSTTKDERKSPGTDEDGTEKIYPKGIPFVILTLALMATVFVVGLDQNILGM
jgi:hypothetical protein